ncbi:LOW QUALITY PROTEIN: alkylglycerol monooxygenase-like [Penaeus monodon]|uniref:LOW QUALITY PROTEIN: alkylglycerol monooxygenase-like n=1 Tax=Penaeus monodon TaxID=6687 RepID=UPI0018A7D0CB|nr:LOW QUALITY PROTEIN: alkylglycerol monooxygenase-like [Penaeus monodon]
MPSLLHRLGTLFYIVSPSSTSFEKREEVPNFTNEALPLFVAMLALEWALLWRQGKKARINDAITSSGHGLVYETSKILSRGAELFAYDWLYRYRVVDLDWDSPVTWFTAALGVDFGVLLGFHRATHETSLGWAAHQVHHSSQEYNLSTALRQSIFQRTFWVVFYNPLALLGIPLPALLVHIQFNLLYQFWIHTEAVGKLGPLEWVLNTPSHHRVHHGANKYCLDKNYGGVLVIWDRLFGTFAEERDDEKLVYGLVDQPQSLNVIWLQMYYYFEVFKKAKNMNTWVDTMKVLFNGPGWHPGTPRLVNPAFFRTPSEWGKYDLDSPYGKVILSATSLWASVLLMSTFILLSVGLIGALYDGWWWAPLAETARCAAFVVYARGTPISKYFLILFGFYFISVGAGWWLIVQGSHQGSKMARQMMQVTLVFF